MVERQQSFHMTCETSFQSLISEMSGVCIFKICVCLSISPEHLPDIYQDHSLFISLPARLLLLSLSEVMLNCLEFCIRILRGFHLPSVMVIASTLAATLELLCNLIIFFLLNYLCRLHELHALIWCTLARHTHTHTRT